MTKPKLKPEELFVKVMLDTLDAPAWRALSHGARSLFIALRRRHRLNDNNNGRIFLSQRAAEREIGSDTNQITRWFRELEHYGFIVMTRSGHLGIEGKGKAPHWRLTDLPYGDEPPTRDFLSWTGIKFGSPKEKIPSVKTRTGCPRKHGHRLSVKTRTPTVQ